MVHEAHSAPTVARRDRAAGRLARRALLGLAAGFMFAATLGTAPARADEVVLRAVAAFPKALAFTKSFLGYVDKVNAAGKGVVRIDFTGGPEVIPQNQQVDSVRRGVLDMHYGPASFYLGKMPEADAWVGATVTAMEARKNGGFAIMQKAFDEKLGVTLLGHIDSGIGFHVYLLKEPKRTADGGVDLNGLKIRSQPIYKSFFEDLGAVSVSVPVPEVYGGLERSVFDGAGWPIIGILDLNWDKFLKVRIDPGFYSTDLGITINTAKWNSLPQAAKDILTKAAIEYEQESFDNFQKEIKATDETARSRGMTVLKLTGAAEKAYLDKAYESAWKRMKDAGSPHYDALRKAYYTR
ncbi:TRAP transporter substrate-binding protein DctP [Prosthecomicrobium hirschii]|nr:TRAP transporter substrate-binding protein DctP [Prosthecomicrobium hirschii]MCW1842596.1 TRAP transporter substrate-binding protein DctP [Prosthecomicrobium hirschii]